MAKRKAAAKTLARVIDPPIVAAPQWGGEMTGTMAVSPILIGISHPVCNGRLQAIFTSKAIDGRVHGWLCKPDGTRVERILVVDLAAAEARGNALIAKGAVI